MAHIVMRATKHPHHSGGQIWAMRFGHWEGDSLLEYPTYSVYFDTEGKVFYEEIFGQHVTPREETRWR